MVSAAENCKEKWIILLKEVFFLLLVIICVPPIILDSWFLTQMLLFWWCYFVKIYENGEMFTWIWVFLLYSWKNETLCQKLKDQKLQTIEL